MKFGKTGNFPRGKLNRHDEGGLAMGITHTASAVVVNFGTPTSWIGLEPDLAEQFAKTILEHAAQIRKGAQ